MRVARYYNNSDIRVEEIPRPSIGPGEILLKVDRAGICGSDVMEWYRVTGSPRVLGHEIAGEVVEVGKGVEGVRKGDRIAASHHVPCYQCHECRLGHHTLCDLLRSTNFDPGGFSEWIRIPEINCRHGLYNLPDHVSCEEATLIEPLACVLRGQKKIDVRPEQTVLVIGSGASGLLHILLARSRGAKRIVACDPVPYRLEAAKAFGADEVLKNLDEVGFADVVIVCAGARQATERALQCVGRGGTVLFFALHGPDQVISLPMNEVFWKKGATLTSTYAASPEDHREALGLIASGRIRVHDLITHRLGLSEIGKGFHLVAHPSESIKVVIDLNR